MVFIQNKECPLASFGVHLSIGLVTSGVAATSAMLAGLASPPEMLAYLGLATVGSLLPDIDADHSAPVQIAFTTASIVLAFTALFALAGLFPSVAELALVWLATYLAFRWLVFRLFTRLTAHRGIFHSLPAALFFGLLTAILAERLADQPPLQAWLAGSFVVFGYLVHLLLDEIYSVNLFGLHTRRSLGSAFKLWSGNSHAASTYMYAACLLGLLLAPSPLPFAQVVSAQATYRQALERLLPADGWFQPLRRQIRQAMTNPTVHVGKPDG